MKKLIEVIIALLILNSSFLIENCNSQWIQMNGPYGANVTCFETSGINIFAGTMGGVYFSTNYGDN